MLPVGDLGVRRGMQRLYGLEELPTPAQMHTIAERWRPFASLGSYYMCVVASRSSCVDQRLQARRLHAGR